MSGPPTTPEAWDASKLTLADMNRLADGQLIEWGWTPPLNLKISADPSPKPINIMCERYRFRLHWHEREGAWYVEGNGPRERPGAFVIVQGPVYGLSPTDYAMKALAEMLLEILQAEGTA